jgi:MICOS complex subunit MIC19
MLELQVQARVADELKKLQANEAAALDELHEKLAAEDSKKDGDNGLSRHGVSKEVEALKAKLESRKKLRQLPESVESARSDVIKCLTENDRRPLDCWKEVERFKEEVKRLEKGWVEKVVG